MPIEQTTQDRDGGTRRIVTSIPDEAELEYLWNSYSFWLLPSGEFVAAPTITHSAITDHRCPPSLFRPWG